MNEWVYCGTSGCPSHSEVEFPPKDMGRSTSSHSFYKLDIAVASSESLSRDKCPKQMSEREEHGAFERKKEKEKDIGGKTRKNASTLRIT